VPATVNILVLAIAAVVVLAIIAVVIIHNHKSLDAVAAKTDALAIKVDPVIRASEASIAQVDAQVAAAVAAKPADAPAQAQ